ncbi:MAG: phage baseplate assembly protein V, partial [Sneathiella sp.]
MNKDFKRYLADITRPMRSSISNMVARGVVTLVDDRLKMQDLQLQLMADELKDNIERFQNYGFTAHPHTGAEALTVFLNGNRDHGITLVVDDRRYRIKGLKQGEVAIYTDEESDGSGHSITLKRGRVIDIRCDDLNITAD